MYSREAEILLFPNTRLKVTGIISLHSSDFGLLLGLMTEEMRKLSNFPENFNVVQLSKVERTVYAAPEPVSKSSSKEKEKSDKKSEKSVCFVLVACGVLQC
jgi:hypothetical protein